MNSSVGFLCRNPLKGSLWFGTRKKMLWPFGVPRRVGNDLPCWNHTNHSICPFSKRSNSEFVWSDDSAPTQLQNPEMRRFPWVFLISRQHLICQTEEDFPFHITRQELSVGLPISANLKTPVIFPMLQTGQACVFQILSFSWTLLLPQSAEW